MHNSLTRSWNHLHYPIPVTVWFRYYRKLEDFVRTSEVRSPLYIHGTVFMPFHIISYDHIRMEVYRMFYFNIPYRLYNFIPRLRFRLLFVSSSTFVRRLASCNNCTSLGMVLDSSWFFSLGGKSGMTSIPSSGYPSSSRPFTVHNMLENNRVMRSRTLLRFDSGDVLFDV